MTPEQIAELEALYANTTDGEWAFKSVGEKCYATILGAAPYYLSGPKARKRKDVEPPISSRGEVYDDFTAILNLIVWIVVIGTEKEWKQS